MIFFVPFQQYFVLLLRIHHQELQNGEILWQVCEVFYLAHQIQQQIPKQKILIFTIFFKDNQNKFFYSNTIGLIKKILNSENIRNLDLAVKSGEQDIYKK